MTKKGDTYLSIPAALSTQIKEIIAHSKGSYETITEFVRDAIHEKIERIGLAKTQQT